MRKIFKVSFMILFVFLLVTLTGCQKEKNELYTITFNSNGGSDVPNITEQYNEELKQIVNPKKLGYTFEGWFSDPELTNKYTFTTMPKENITLYAKWSINRYNLTFNTNGGTDILHINEEYGATVTKPTDPTKEGYTFAGWYGDPELKNSYTFDTMPAANYMIYAKWTINQYTISFDSNGGTSVSSITGDYNSSVTQPTNPTKTGFTFVGWYSDSSFTNAYVFSKMPAEHITLYAKWNEVNENTPVVPIVSLQIDYTTTPATSITTVGWNQSGVAELSDGRYALESIGEWIESPSFEALTGSITFTMNALATGSISTNTFKIEAFKSDGTLSETSGNITVSNAGILSSTYQNYSYTFTNTNRDITKIRITYNKETSGTNLRIGSISILEEGSSSVDKVISSISASFGKTQYTISEVLSLTGSSLTIHYSDGTTLNQTLSESMITNFSTANVGTFDATVTYQGFTDTVTYTVSEALNPPTNNDYGNYYSSISSDLSSVELKAALHNLIDQHTSVSYTEAENKLKITDADPNNANNILLFYTGRSQPKDTDGTNSDNWNREHIWANSHGIDDAYPAYSDLHHLRATDVSMNSARGNLDFGDVSNTDSNKVIDTYGDVSSYNYKTSMYFEPRDEIKGDVARMLFYMVVRYEGDSGEPDLELVNGTSTSTSNNIGDLATLLQWHLSDPVDQSEINRNQSVYGIQGNRNPFIDRPEYASIIFS